MLVRRLIVGGVEMDDSGAVVIMEGVIERVELTKQGKS